MKMRSSDADVYSASGLIKIMKKNNKPIRETAFLFQYCSMQYIDPEYFRIAIDPFVGNMVSFIHEKIFSKRNLDLHNKEFLKEIEKELYDSLLSNYNSLDMNICPFRFMIEDCCMIECKNGSGIIHTEDQKFKNHIKQSNVIQSIYSTLKRINNERFELAKESSEFLIFDVVLFTKYAPLCIIDPITGDDWFNDGGEWNDNYYGNDE